MTASIGAGHPPSPPLRGLQGGLTALLIVLWAAELLVILLPGQELLRSVGAVGLVAFVAGALVVGRNGARLFCAVTLGLSAWVVGRHGDWALLWQGWQNALVFAAFLPTLALLRGMAGDDPRLARYQETLARDDTSCGPQDRAPWLLVGAYAIAGALAMGAAAVLAAFANKPGTHEPLEHGERIRAGQAVVCGTGLAVLWSPFFVALAVVSQHLPALPLWQIMGTGFALSVVACVLAAVTRMSVRRPIVLWRVVLAVRPLAAPILLAALAVMTVSAVTGLPTLQTVLVVVPALCLLILPRRPSGTVGRLAGTTMGSLMRMRDEVTIVCCAMILGTVLRGTPEVATVAATLLPAGLPDALVIAAGVLGLIVSSMVGVHPLVGGVTMLALLSSTASPLPDLVIAMTVLLGWSLSSMVCIPALNVVVVASMFDTERHHLVLGDNLRFAALFVPLGVGCVVALNALLSP